MELKLKEAVKKLYFLDVNLDKEENYALSGVVHKLVTPNGSYILKRHDHQLVQERIGLQHRITEKIRKDGLSIVPKVYPIIGDSDDVETFPEFRTIFKHDGQIYALYEFKEGKFHSWDKSELSNVAKNLARLHRYTSEFVSDKYSNRERTKKEIKELTALETRLLKDSSEKIIKHTKNLAPLIKSTKKSLEYLSTESEEKKAFEELTLIHGDFHQKNVFFLDEKVSAIFDFDSLREDRRAYDLAFAIHEFSSIYKSEEEDYAFDGLDPERAVVFIDSYQRKHSLPEPFMETLLTLSMTRFLKRLSFELGNRRKENIIENLLITLEKLPESYKEIAKVLENRK